MHLPRPYQLLAALVLSLAVLAACTQTSPTATSAPPTVTPTTVPATPTSTPNPFAGVAGIVDPTNSGWPRTVEGMNGQVTIQEKPDRILTVSLGHDEVTFGLVPRERVLAVYSYTQDPTFSNVAEQASGLPNVGRDPEQIVSFDPDIVIASPFTSPDLINSLGDVDIPVLQTQLHDSPEGRIQDLLLMGYVYGEEERAIRLANEVERRYEDLVEKTHSTPADQRPSVLSLAWYSDQHWVAGEGSTEGSIIEAAGGVNAAAKAGVEQHKTVSVESLLAMAPEVIIIPMPPDAGQAFEQQLKENQALANVPAIKNGRVHVVQPRFFTTLSYWNIRGAEELASILWPGEFEAVTFEPFSFPQQGEE